MNTIGYFQEYYEGSKYIGKLECKEQPNRTIGYAGKADYVANTDINLGRKKIKAGSKYTTIYYEMQGKSTVVKQS